MCRLFGLLGAAPRPAETWLVSSDRSLLRQANVTETTRQGDGWGVAWYDERRRPHLTKGTGCAADPVEREAFSRAAQAAGSPLVLGHLRRASNPLGLPHEKLIDLSNSQPFAYGSTIFAHNGSIPLPVETRALTGRYHTAIEGVNDSEVLFYLLLRHLDSEPDPARAYARTVADLSTVWEAHGRPTPFPYSGLNVLLARGPHELWAFCLALGDHGTSLLDSSCPYYEMTFAADSDHLLVASERLDSRRTDWRPLPNGSYLVGQDDRGNVKWRTGTIPALAPSAPIARAA
ncbi:MAG: class II glutamine amidotransferase [Thermoplasmata archaeon]